MKKAIVTIIVLAVLAPLGWFGYGKLTAVKQDAGARRGGGALAVEVTAVRSALIHDVGVFTGTLLPSEQFVVAPKIVGRLERLLVDVSDRVKAGQLIAELDADEYARQVDQARAEWELAKANADQVRLNNALADEELAGKVDQAKADLDAARASVREAESSLQVAKAEFDRAEALSKKKIISSSEYDTSDAQYKAAKAKHEGAADQATQKEAAFKSTIIRTSDAQKAARAAEFKVAEAQVAQKNAAMRAAEVRLSYTQIKAPAWKDDLGTWVVGERFVYAGAMLKDSAPIVSLLNIAALKAIIYVTERDYTKVRPGQDVVVSTDAVAGRTFTGRVARVAPVLGDDSVQARVEAEILNADLLLKPGMFIRARIEFARRDNAPVIPENAFVKRGEQQGLFLADPQEKKARFVAAAKGIVEGDLAEILAPAQPVEHCLIVTAGQHLLEDGSPIILPGEKPAAAPAPKEPAPAGRKGTGGG